LAAVSQGTSGQATSRPHALSCSLCCLASKGLACANPCQLPGWAGMTTPLQFLGHVLTSCEFGRWLDIAEQCSTVRRSRLSQRQGAAGGGGGGAHGDPDQQHGDRGPDERKEGDRQQVRHEPARSMCTTLRHDYTNTTVPVVTVEASAADASRQLAVVTVGCLCRTCPWLPGQMATTPCTHVCGHSIM
jgi:hypothetical protein